MADPGLYAPWSNSTHPGDETPITAYDFSVNVAPWDDSEGAYWYVFAPVSDGKITIDTWASTQMDGVTQTSVEAYIAVISGGSGMVRDEFTVGDLAWMERVTLDVTAGVPVYFQVSGDIYDYTAGAYTQEPLHLVVRVAQWTPAYTERIVVRDFEGTAVGGQYVSSGSVPTDSPTDVAGGPKAFYGGDDWAWASSSFSAYEPANCTYDDQAAFGSRSLFFPKILTNGTRARSTGWAWDGDGDVCGLEVSFKVQIDGDTDPLDDNILLADLQVGQFSRPHSNFFATFRPTGIWWAGASGQTADGTSVGPGTTLFQGDGTDVMPVDYSQWMTMKMLPTGEYSLAYADGGVLLSGTLVDVTEGLTAGASRSYLDVSSGRDRGASNFWIDNAVFYLFHDSTLTMPEVVLPPPAPPLTGRLKGTNRRFKTSRMPIW